MKLLIFFCFVALAFAEPEKKTCLEEPDEGMCRAYFEMYYYDYKSRSCKKFIYGGCDGNGNRYATEDECLSNCGDVIVIESPSDSVCELPAETGVCRAYIPRYFFNKDSGKCERFVYGGCGGNENNFETVEACENRCKRVVESPSNPICELQAVTGYCKARMPRFYFNKNTGECERFIYGGCGGNENNFQTVDECERSCKNE